MTTMPDLPAERPRPQSWREAGCPHERFEVEGAYEVDLPAGSTAVAVRITDMLGVEVLVVLPVTADA